MVVTDSVGRIYYDLTLLGYQQDAKREQADDADGRPHFIVYGVT